MCGYFVNDITRHYRQLLDIPEAFLEIMELDIRGMDPTVPVMSLIPYNTLSAGTSESVCPTMQQPTFSRMSHICLESMFTWKPGMDSNLSRVPPSLKQHFSIIIAIIIVHKLSHQDFHEEPRYTGSCFPEFIVIMD